VEAFSVVLHFLAAIAGIMNILAASRVKNCEVTCFVGKIG